MRSRYAGYFRSNVAIDSFAAIQNMTKQYMPTAVRIVVNCITGSPRNMSYGGNFSRGGGGGGGGYGGGGSYGDRGGGGGGYGGGGGDGERRGPPPRRPGDWDCPSCSAVVFASRAECFKCKGPRPGGACIFR